MISFRSHILVLILSLFYVNLFGQGKTLTFSLQVEPLIPSDLIRSNNVKAYVDAVEFSSDPLRGIGYGAGVSYHFHPKLALQTGINYLKRDSKITATELNDFILELRYTVDNFEIPLTANYFVRLGEKVYMDGSVGFSFQFLPGELKSRKSLQNDIGGYIYDFSQISWRNYWVMPVFRGGFGFEYRTEKSGSFYIGPVFRLFSTLYYTQILYMHNDINISNLVIKPAGDYFSIAFKYIFPHETPKKEK